MDTKAFQKMSYGLYLVSSNCDGKTGGCVVNTLMQVTSKPLQVTLTINKDNYTTSIIEKSGYFEGVALSQEATMELIRAFGFQSSKDKNKFEGFETEIDCHDIPYVCEQVVARYTCKVKSSMDVGTHKVFLAEIDDAEVLDKDEPPMTYAYYHSVKKGVTPPKASSYIPEEKKTGYRCQICGYILAADTIPKDYVCPVCGNGREQFVKL